MLATWAAVDLRRFLELDPTHHSNDIESKPARSAIFDVDLCLMIRTVRATLNATLSEDIVHFSKQWRIKDCLEGRNEAFRARMSDCEFPVRAFRGTGLTR